MKMTARAALAGDAGELAQGLAHQAGLQADVESPIWPSSSGAGTSAATESTTITSSALERTSISQISSACSPESGWLTIRLFEVDAELLGPGRIEGVLGIDEGGHAAASSGPRR
jgi:hypothetical protein